MEAKIESELKRLQKNLDQHFSRMDKKLEQIIDEKNFG